jgi:hypothetical protein
MTIAAGTRLGGYQSQMLVSRKRHLAPTGWQKLRVKLRDSFGRIAQGRRLTRISSLLLLSSNADACLR